MKTVVMMPSEAECEIVVKDQQGKEIKVGSIEITPTFYNPKSTPVVLFFETRGDDYVEVDEDEQEVDKQGPLLQRGVVTVSGTTGKLNVGDRTTSVRSKLEADMDEEESKQETTAKSADDDEPVVKRSRKKGVR